MRRLMIIGVLAMAMALLMIPTAALAHGGEVAIVVEAKASDPLDPLHTDYAMTLTFEDGDPVEGATVTASATDGSETVAPLEVTAEGTTYFVHFVYPSPGNWTLVLEVDHPDVQAELTLIETIPVGDPGSQLVRLDTADEARVGTAGLLAIPDHPLAEPSPTTSTTAATTGESTTTTTSATTTTVASAPSTTVAASETHGGMVQVTTSGVLSLPVELLFRWAHLGMLTLWGLAVLAMLVRLEHRLLPAATLAGLVGTLATGLLLGLWGTPVGFPGIFRWSDLGALEYGGAWQSSFLLKMGAVVVASIGTAAALRRRSWGAWVGAAGMGLALIVVTALSQFHLLTHG